MVVEVMDRLHGRMMRYARPMWLYMMPILVLFWIFAYFDYQSAYRAPAQILGVLSRVDASPGGAAIIKLAVDRSESVRRDCNATIDRYVQDSSGNRPFAVRAGTLTSAELAIRNRYSPGVAWIDFTVPEDAATGPGVYLFWIKYTCEFWHRIFGPVIVHGSAPIEILRPVRSMP